VITILKGQIRKEKLSGGWHVRSLPVDLYPRQIVVGISISNDNEDDFRDELPIIPAILDTGFNKSFSIHQYYLEQAAHIPKAWLAHNNNAESSETSYLGHPYDTCHASLWLHRRTVVNA
jgi:hypothetical protein